MAASKNQTTKEILRILEYQIEQIFTEVEKIKQDQVKLNNINPTSDNIFFPFFNF